MCSVKMMRVAEEEAPAKYVPGGGVISREQAVKGFSGCKGGVVGLVSQK